MAAVLAFQPYEVVATENEWTPTVESVVAQIKANAELVAKGEQPVIVNQPYIGCKDDAEARSVMNKISRAANALGYGARKRFLGNNEQTTGPEDAILLIVTIGNKKSPKTVKTVADAVAEGKGTK